MSLQRIRDWIFGETVLVVDHGQGLYRSSSDIIHFKPENIMDYFTAYEDYDLIRAPLDDLVEQATGQGFYTSVDIPEESLDDMDHPGYRAKELCDNFAKAVNLDKMLPNITRINLIAGFCPLETKIVSDPEKCSLMIIHPKTIDNRRNKGVEWANGKVTRVYQKVGAEEGVTPDPEKNSKLVWFNYCQIGNNPLGTSYVRGMLKTLNTLNEATADIDKILKRYIGPKAVWKTRRDIDNLKIAVQESTPGEDLFLGKLTTEEVTDPNFPTIIQIDPRVPYWEWIEYLDRRLFAYSRASNIWYFKDATVASAKEMEDIVQRHVGSIQREDKRSIERDLFTPLLLANNIDLEWLPKINFGIELTGVEDLEPGPIIMKGLDYGYLSKAQYYHILGQMGIKVLKGSETNSEEPVEEPSEEEPTEPEED